MAEVVESAPFSVDGKTAIITGAGSGINFCFAKLLLARNCNVLIADVALRPEAQKLVDDHSSRDAGKPRAVFVRTDVTIWDQLTRMFDEADREFGGADIVCPGAGVFEPPWSNFWHPPGTSESRDAVHGSASDGVGHYATLDINLTHPIRSTQLAISRWLNPPPAAAAKGKVDPSNPKRIVHISSIAGQAPGLIVPLYVASKHAMSGFIRSMGPLSTIGIKVNGVAPGIIRTPLWTDHPEKMKMLDQEVDTLVEPEDVAEQMLRCCEDDAIGSGVVWEVLKDQYRVVEWKMDPGPQGLGSGTSNGAVLAGETFALLAQEGWGKPKG